MSRKTSLAKISRPRLFGVVPRERLFAMLDDNRGRPLVWISGPPGAGKTALVASYLENRGLPAVWYQIDAGDADPASLFHYLALAAEGLGATGSTSLPRFVPEHLSDLPSFARLFFRAFFAQLPERIILVLDNYQEAPEDALLHETLRQAVVEVPPESSVIAISRVEAPRNFVQLAAQGAMTELGWDKLQLTLEEVRAIAAKRSVTDDWLLKALHQQSQGWAAGITLMLERLGHFDGKSQELPTETRESVFNYFASLIFDQAPQVTRHILLSIAFLPQVTPNLARELSGCAEAPTLLEDLYRRRMFTDRRSGAEPVYQFHALFLDYLRTQARKIHSSQEFAMLLRRSASALQRTGEIDAVMDLWLEARDWNQAIQLILREANGLLGSGRRQTLERWIQTLPAEVLEQNPWIVYWLGLAHVQTVPARGIETLQLALSRFRESGDDQGEVLCLSALLNAAFLGFVALDTMDCWLDELLVKVERLRAFSSPDVGLRVWGILCSALFWIRPWHPWTADAANRVEALLACGGDRNAALAAAASALATTSMDGEFDCGDRIALATGYLVDSPSASPTEATWWLVHAGFLRFFEARYEDALDFMHHACQIADRNGMRKTFVMCIFHRCAIEFRVSGWTVANATLTEMEAMPGARYPMAQAMLSLLQARRAQFRGRREEAADLAELTHAATLRIGSRYQEMLFGLLEAELLLDAGRIDKARPLIARSRTLIEQTSVFDCWRAALVFVEAWLASVEGNWRLVLERLRSSLSLAKEGKRKHYLRHFECAMPPLFRLALDQGIEVDLVQDIIRMFRLKAPKDAPDLWPWPVRIFTLGRFDIQVNGASLEFSRKVPRKTLLLLKATVALGGRDVSEEALCDALWRDEEGDAARNALSITVLRLRKLLGSNESVIHQGGKVSLNPEMCWVDAWVFEARLIETGFDSQKVLALYGGTFLPEDEGEPWSVASRERLRGKFIDALSRYGTTLESEGDLPGAVQYYLRGIDADPIVESFHLGLMRCYERLGKRTEALSVYRRLKHTLSVVLGVPPSDATQRLFQDMLQRQSKEGLLVDPNSENLRADPAAPSASGMPLAIVAKLPIRLR